MLARAGFVNTPEFPADGGGEVPGFFINRFFQCGIVFFQFTVNPGFVLEKPQAHEIRK